MANVVKPNIKNVGESINIKQYNYNNTHSNNEQSNLKIDNAVPAEQLSTNIIQNYGNHVGETVKPQLTDVMSAIEGKIESILERFHIFDEVITEGDSGKNDGQPKPTSVPEQTPTPSTVPAESTTETEKPKTTLTPAPTPKPSETPKPTEKPTAKPEPSQNNQTGSGKTTNIPNSVRQTGIIANYTQNYGTRGWVYNQGKLANAYKAAGSKADGNMATINGRYLVAVSPRFGKVGDNIDIKLENGNVIHAVIADIKGSDATSSWGHELSGKVDVVEWEINGTSQSELSKNLKNKGWYGSPVTSITNTGFGNYF